MADSRKYEPVEPPVSAKSPSREGGGRCSCASVDWRRFWGLALMALSALFFATASFLVSLIARNYKMASFEIVFCRSVVVGVIGVALVLYKRVRPVCGLREHRTHLLARGFLGFVGLSCGYFAISNMPLADATVLMFTAPVWTGMMARCVLKEPWGRLDALCALISLAGIVLVTRPPFIFGSDSASADNSTVSSTTRLLAACAALAQSIVGSLVSILVRTLQGVDALVIVNYFSLFAVLLSPIGLFSLQTSAFVSGAADATSALLWCLLLLTGALGFLGQALKTRSLQMELAGPATMMRNLDIVFAFMFQIAFLGDVPTVYSVVGAVLVTVGVMVTGIRKLLNKHEHVIDTAAPASASARAQDIASGDGGCAQDIEMQSNTQNGTSTSTSTKSGSKGRRLSRLRAMLSRKGKGKHGSAGSTLQLDSAETQPLSGVVDIDELDEKELAQLDELDELDELEQLEQAEQQTARLDKQIMSDADMAAFEMQSEMAKLSEQADRGLDALHSALNGKPPTHSA